jgi:Bax protein
MILIANDEIRVERNKVLEIQQQKIVHHQLNPAQQHILTTLAKRYKIRYRADQPQKMIQKLLNRIDIIPADLALAQAANESAWGTSRFSQLANNLFGQWTFTPGQGIVPEGRPEGQTYEVQKFLTIYDSVRSYLHNLNTHPAYKQLRRLRAKNRQTGKNPEGVELAEGLLRYSIRGEAYVKELQAMIKTNHLDRFATAKLRTTRQSAATTGSFAFIQR